MIMERIVHSRFSMNHKPEIKAFFFFKLGYGGMMNASLNAAQPPPVFSPHGGKPGVGQTRKPVACRKGPRYDIEM